MRAWLDAASPWQNPQAEYVHNPARMHAGHKPNHTLATKPRRLRGISTALRLGAHFCNYQINVYF